MRRAKGRAPHTIGIVLIVISSIAMPAHAAEIPSGTTLTVDAAVGDIVYYASLGIGYSGQFGEDNRDHSGRVNLRWRF
ncbi:MAG TPA: hypothetical protein VIQ01_00380 [Burkholderiales bacterium]|jgi:hypothetical protein